MDDRERPETPLASRADYLVLPWHLLVRPLATWRALVGNTGMRTWGPALLVQWLLLGSAQVVALQPSFELARYSGLTTNQLPPSWFAVIWQVMLFALGLAMANLSLAGVIFLLARLVSINRSFASTLTLASYTLLPVVLGTALGSLVFAFTQPLTRQPAHALALLVRPFSPGFAAFPPISNEPLSLAWVFASYIDVFTVWSLVVFALGSTVLLNLSAKRTSWLCIGLVLSLCASLTAWWRVLQFAALR